MSMFDNLKSKLGIDTEADSYIDDTEDEIFAGGRAVLRCVAAQPSRSRASPTVKMSPAPTVRIRSPGRASARSRSVTSGSVA